VLGQHRVGIIGETPGGLADDPDAVLAKHGYCVAAMCDWETRNNGAKLVATIIEKTD